MCGSNAGGGKVTSSKVREEGKTPESLEVGDGGEKIWKDVPDAGGTISR